MVSPSGSVAVTVPTVPAVAFSLTVKVTESSANTGGGLATTALVEVILALFPELMESE